MSDYKQILESLLCDFKEAISKQDDSCEIKVLLIDTLIGRYEYFLKNPDFFEQAKKIMN